MTALHSILLMLLTALLACRATADTVALRSAAQVRADTPIRLADIAETSGEQADLLSQAVILDASTAAKRCKNGTLSIDISEVRSALAAAKNVNMGRVALSGSAVSVTISTASPTTTQTALPTLDSTGETLADALPAALARWIGVEPDTIQLDTSAVDPKILATPLANRTYVVFTSTRSEVLPVQIRVFEGDTPVLTETIRVGIKVRREAGIATRDLKRGEVLSLTDFRVEPSWVSSAVTPADAASVPGATARTTIKAGSVIEDRQVDHPPTIQRGELVSVDCVAGTVILRATMRAREDGRVGDVIWLEPVAKKSARRSAKEEAQLPSPGGGPVRARIAGSGRAVTVAGEDAGTGVAEEEQPEDPGSVHSSQGSASVGTVDVHRLATGH